MNAADDLSGRSFLVTGANTGIGKETARDLARRGAHVTLAGRSEEKTRAAMADIAPTPIRAMRSFFDLIMSISPTITDRHIEGECIAPLAHGLTLLKCLLGTACDKTAKLV